MFDGATLSTSNYDSLLNGWDAQTLQNGVIFSGGNSTYCVGEAARANMIASDSWSITDGGKDCPTDDFVITVKTDNTGPSSNTQFTIPTTGTGYNYNVDCDNDGTDEATAQTGDYICDYGSLGGVGTYTVRIKDNSGTGTGFPRIYFADGGDKEKLLSIEQWGTGQWTSMAFAFYGCSNLAGGAVDVPDLSGVTNMNAMFRDAIAFNGDIGSWNTTNVTDISYMFSGATAFNGNIASWNTGTVTNMGSMFRDATAFNGDIGSWDTTSVTDMSFMFSYAAAFNGNIGSWDTGAVTTMNSMFRNASTFNGDIGNWETGAVTDMRTMFGYASAFNQNIGSWNTGAVTNMRYMFYYANAFDQNIGSWNTGAVTEMRSMFYQASNFNGDIGSWNTGAVTDMDHMFYFATSFNKNIGSWNTAAVTDMSYMFRNASSFNGDIGSWDTGVVTDMSHMFYNATSFNQDIGSWDVVSLASADNMFLSAKLSTTNYDSLLNGWNVQTLHNGVSFGGGNSTYCAGEAARANMISSDSWVITDGGKDCPSAPTDDFVITVQTDNPGTSSNTQFTIPTSGGRL